MTTLILLLAGCFGPECSVDDDCSESYICDDTLDECVYGCRTDEDCPEDEECDRDENECVELPQDANSG